MNKMKIIFFGFIIWLIAALINVGVFLGMDQAIGMFRIWQNIGIVAVAIFAVGILVIALSLDPLKKYLESIILLKATKIIGVLGAITTLILAYFLFTTELVMIELGTNNLLNTTTVLSTLLIGIFLVLISLILFVGRYQMKEITKLPSILEIAIAGALMSAIAGFIIISEIVLPSNISIFISIPALILDALLFFKLSYFE